MSNFKLILGIGIIVIAIFLGIQVVPPYYSNYEFQDTINHDALDFTYRTVGEDDIKAQVLKDAKQYDIPLAENNVKVSRTGEMGSGTVSINVNYVVHVDVPFYPFDLHFNPSSANKGFY